MKVSVRIAKRAVDVVGAAMGLALSAPLMPIIGAAIYLDSPGPIFFRQRRAGRLLESDGRQMRFNELEMIKFRTMRIDAEAGTGAVLATQDDPRVTRVGRFLRKTRLDELPQLWNVLTGSMSLVGPRPERPEILENFARAIPFFEERMRDVKPGITGLAQISLEYTGRPLPGSDVAKHVDSLTNPFDIDGARGALADDMRIKLLHDMAYVATLEDLSTYFTTELFIIAKTPLAMIRALGR